MIAVFLALAPATRAEHGSPWVHPFPADGSELPANGRIVLISMNGQSSDMPKVGGKGLVLESDGNRAVPVRVVEAHDDPDGYGEASAVLVPSRRLVVGAKYTLRWPGSGYKFSWTVSRKRDRKAPVWKAQPVVEIAAKDDPGFAGSPLVRIAARDDTAHIALRVTLTSANKIVRTAIWDFVRDCAFTGYLATGMTGPVRVRIELLDAAGRTARAKRSIVLPARDSSAYLCRSP